MIKSAAAKPKVAQRGFAVSIAMPTGNKTQGEIMSKRLRIEDSDHGHQHDQTGAVDQESPRGTRQPPRDQSHTEQDRETRGNAEPPIPGSDRFADEKRKYAERQVRKNRHGRPDGNCIPLASSARNAEKRGRKQTHKQRCGSQKYLGSGRGFLATAGEEPDPLRDTRERPSRNSSSTASTRQNKSNTAQRPRVWSSRYLKVGERQPGDQKK